MGAPLEKPQVVLRELRRGFAFLIENSDGEVRRYESDFRLQEEWSIPGAYRSDFNNGILWVSSVTGDSVWEIESGGGGSAQHLVPEQYRTPPENMYLSDVSWTGETLLISDRSNERVLTFSPDEGDASRWDDVALESGSEPTLWIEREQSPSVVISRSDGLL